MANRTKPVGDVVEEVTFGSLVVTQFTDAGGRGDVIEVTMTESTEDIGDTVDGLLAYDFTPRFWSRDDSKLQFVRL